MSHPFQQDLQFRIQLGGTQDLAPAWFRAFDWSGTAVGPRTLWPQSLRASLSICLGSPYPCMIWWGPRLTQFLNDPCRSLLRPTNDSQALGDCGAQFWTDAWQLLAPSLEEVMATGRPCWSPDLPLPVGRLRRRRNCCRVSLSPIIAEGHAVGGVFGAVLKSRARLPDARPRARIGEPLDRLLFDHNPDGVFVVDPIGRFVVANPACEVISGYSRAELLEKTFMEICAPDELARTLAIFQRGLREHAFLQFETALIHKEGRRVPLSIAGAIGLLEGHAVMQCTAKDITQRKQVEAEAQALNQALEQRVAERTALAEWRASQLQRLAAQMTQTEERERRRLSQLLHDSLQQLLVAAKIRLGIARRGLLDANAARAVGDAVNLVDEAITESRSLTRELSPPVLYDGGLAASLDWLGRDTSRKYQLPVAVKAAPGIEPDDLATKVFVFQAARELILNAVKHSQATSLAIHLLPAGEDCLQVVVQDNGKGFDVQILDGSTTRDGFGLFSIRERLDVIGGKLTVSSTRGEGTSAVIVVPSRRSASHELASQCAARELTLPGALTTRTDRIRVLLADDHPVLRKGLADLLTGHPELSLVGEAQDGLEAVEMALRLRPDVVLMDITMPRVDGIQATRHIKSAAPEIPVIGLSMHETDDMVCAMRGAGASNYLSKTAPVEELIAAILRACPRKHRDPSGPISVSAATPADRGP